MKNALMGKALKAKLGNGINLTIMLGDATGDGEAEENKETKEMGLAPAGATQPNKEQGEADIAKAKMTHSLMPDEGDMNGDAGIPNKPMVMEDAQHEMDEESRMKKIEEMLGLGLGKNSLTARAVTNLKKGK